MSLKNYTANFLLIVTQIKTTNPSVTRLFSAPFDLTFRALHKAIEASFGWSDGDMKDEYDDVVHFMVVDGFQPAIRPNLANTIVEIETGTTHPQLDQDIIDTEYNPNKNDWPHFSCHTTKLKDIFCDPHCREKSIVYDHHEGVQYWLNVLGQSPFGTGGKVVCLGGQGHSSKTAWEFEKRHHVYSDWYHSSWDLDMDKVMDRVAAVEEARLAGQTHDGPAIEQELIKRKSEEDH